MYTIIKAVCIFSRTYDSYYLDSALYSELPDVQWYGQEKAKPGTLV